MRVFKTASFARVVRKALISDAELCDAAREAAAGQAIDLGGGVFKKRLHRNQHRSIILARGGRLWIYVYLFAKKDKANISASELAAFRLLAKRYEALTAKHLDDLLTANDLREICRDPA
jgi:hypothetical protein